MEPYSTAAGSGPYGPVRHRVIEARNADDPAHDQRSELMEMRIVVLETQMQLVQSQASQALEAVNKASDHLLHAHSRIDTLFQRFTYWNSTLQAAFAAWCRNWVGDGDGGDAGGDGAEWAGEMQVGEP